MKKTLGLFIIIIQCTCYSCNTSGQAPFNMADFALRSRISMLIESHDITKATTILDSLEHLSQNKSNPLIRYYRAKCLYKQNKCSEAIQICSDEIMKHSQTDSLLYWFYGLKINSLRKSGDFKNACSENQKLIKLFPNDAYSYANLSYYLGELGDYKGCIDALETSVKLDPKNILAYSNLAYYSSIVGDYNKAINYANQGLLITKDSITIGSLINNRGFGKIGLKQYDSALVDIDKSLKYYPKNSYAYYNKALIYIQF
ncbi:MAG TPA: tetratricopeptide repeat protein [Bacteroidia bacterium]|nr:tetratricopeptide repeat protein [Bacteroidia bacterium]